MKKTGAWLVRYALESIGVKFTFGIPGVHNTEIYDQLGASKQIQPILVTHEGNGAFMADAISRTSETIGTLVIVPAAGVTQAASGIGEAFLDGIPLLIIAGGIRNNTDFSYQLHEIDQHQLLKAITKQTYCIERHDQIIPTLFEAYHLACGGEPGPVFIEIPVNIQIDSGEVPSSMPIFTEACTELLTDPLQQSQIMQAAQMLKEAQHPGLFLGWGARYAVASTQAIADLLHSPVATTLQGLSVFPATHPLHVGMSFGPASVPAAENAFKHCDCLLAVGTRFAEIASGSYDLPVPANLIHIDINPQVFNGNYPCKIALEGDAKQILPQLLKALQQDDWRSSVDGAALTKQIANDKRNYQSIWLKHNNDDQVNPAVFFKHLRAHLPDDGIVVADDGNHTFLTAELMPIHQSMTFISPTDFNCMGYAVPAVIGVKLANPDKKVVGIIGDGAFLMTAVELVTAVKQRIGAVFFIFNDGELSQIAQAQQAPYNRKTCTIVSHLKIASMAEATGVAYLAMPDNISVEQVIATAFAKADQGQPVLVDVNIDYSKATRFTSGAMAINLKRFPLPTKARVISRALLRKVTG